MNRWIKTYLEWTEDLESSESFLIWGGYAVLAANLGRRVYLKAGFRDLYPNLYIVLVGPSGGSRKGTAFRPANQLAHRCGTVLCPEKISGGEKFAHKMAEQAFEEFRCRDRGLTSHNNMACFSGELIVFLRTPPTSLQFLSDLTDLYDSPDYGWGYESFKHDTIEIKNAIFTLLGAASPEHLQEMFPGKFMQGGFASRVIFVYAPWKRKTVPLESEPNEATARTLLAGLAEMRKMSGQVKPTRQALKWYGDWYEDQDKKALLGEWAVSDPLFHAYCDRRQDHLRKIGILNAVAENRMEIQLDDYLSALKLMETTELNMPLVFGGRGSAPYSEMTFRVREMIERRVIVTRSEIMRAFPNDIDQQIMDRIEHSLFEMGIIDIAQNGRGKRYTFLGVDNAD